MAKFLDTQAISNELMKLIKEARDKIILISYSFKVNPQIQERLKTKSRIGNLSEIVIVYGKTELKNSELQWIQEIQDLKIYEKLNLHAKCYMNEERAIICSMNLYDYSQQNNIEMGILITKTEDKEAYEELIEEINNIKINGNRKSLSDLQSKNSPIENISILDDKNSEKAYKEQKLFSPDQKLNFQLLKTWRLIKSKAEKLPAFTILTDNQISEIVAQDNIDKNILYGVLPKKAAIRYGDDIIGVLVNGSKYTIGLITAILYQSDDSKYDRVKMKSLRTGEERWFDTTQELPVKDKIVAVKLNNSWFNEYIYLDN